MLDDPLDSHSADKDLLFIEKQVQIKVSVDDIVYNLLGEISSSSESESKTNVHDELEKYLVADPLNSDSQMARKKQTARKQDNEPANISSGGLPLVLNPLDSDSSIEQAASALGPMSMNRQSPHKHPAVTGFTSDEGAGTDGSSHLKRVHTEGDKTESEQEVQPPRKTGLGQGKPGRKILKSTPLRKGKSTPKKKPSMKELTASWNR